MGGGRRGEGHSRLVGKRREGMVKRTIFHCVFILLISDSHSVLFIHSFRVFIIIGAFFFEQYSENSVRSIAVVERERRIRDIKNVV